MKVVGKLRVVIRILSSWGGGGRRKDLYNVRRTNFIIRSPEHKENQHHHLEYWVSLHITRTTVFISQTCSESQRLNLCLSINCRVHHIVGPGENQLTACRWQALAFLLPQSWPSVAAHAACDRWSPSAKCEHPIPLKPFQASPCSSLWLSWF